MYYVHYLSSKKKKKKKDARIQKKGENEIGKEGFIQKKKKKKRSVVSLICPPEFLRKGPSFVPKSTGAI